MSFHVDARFYLFRVPTTRIINSWEDRFLEVELDEKEEKKEEWKWGREKKKKKKWKESRRGWPWL